MVPRTPPNRPPAVAVSALPPPCCLSERTGFRCDVQEACLRCVDGVQLPAPLGPVRVVASAHGGRGAQRCPAPGVQRRLSVVLQVGGGVEGWGEDAYAWGARASACV